MFCRMSICRSLYSKSISRKKVKKFLSNFCPKSGRAESKTTVRLVLLCLYTEIKWTPKTPNFFWPFRYEPCFRLAQENPSLYILVKSRKVSERSPKVPKFYCKKTLDTLGHGLACFARNISLLTLAVNSYNKVLTVSFSAG